MRWPVLVIVLINGCIDTNSVVCSDGQVCPGNTVCTPLPHIANDPNAELCASLDAIAACSGKQENDVCAGGACHDGVCQPIACGNGYTDPGEACDDGNNVSGDGCAADCLSTEVCGNGVRDAATFEQCDDGNLLDGDGCDSTCITELPAWKSIALNQLLARTNTAMAFDPIHGQLVLFGGQDTASHTVMNDTWLWNGSSWTRATPRSVPPGRQSHAMIYDAALHAVVMYGGNNGLLFHDFSDTWLWNGHDWIQAHPSAVPPKRDGAALAYDGKRQRVILFGGHFQSPQGLDNGYYGDTWVFDGDWKQLTTTTVPENRQEAMMTYDPLRDVVVMFGGVSANNPIAQKTWSFDGTDWHANTPTVQPTARYGAQMAWDAQTHTIMMFGGIVSGADVSETWQWIGSSWTQLTLATKPAARDAFGLATDATRIIAFGGPDAITWQWNGTAWSDVSPYTPNPSPAANGSAFDLRRGRMLFGFSGGTLSSDGSSWKVLPQSLSESPSTPATTYDLGRDQTIVFGNSAPGSNQTWLGSATAWTQASATTLPPARTDARLAYDAETGDSVLFGGNTGGSSPSMNDTWTWDGTSWRQEAPAHVPPKRIGANVAYDWIRRQVVMFGGSDQLVPLADQWTWDGTDWTQVTASVMPTARSDAAFVYDPRRRSLLLIGNRETSTDDVWEWNGTTWSAIDAGAGPVARSSAAAFQTRDGAVYLSGGEAPGILNFIDYWQLVWENTSQPETCVVPLDLDGDGLAGCADPDCYYVCNPTCLPGTTCDATQPHCGDDVCDPLETCRMCPQDCGACAAVCGDSFCDPGETPANCPGDC